MVVELIEDGKIEVSGEETVVFRENGKDKFRISYSEDKLHIFAVKNGDSLILLSESSNSLVIKAGRKNAQS